MSKGVWGNERNQELKMKPMRESGYNTKVNSKAMDRITFELQIK